MNSILNFRSGHTAHLSDEQIEDQLIGDPTAEAAAHLAECEPCTLRVAAAALPMAHFRAVATEWSERRSATMPQVVTAHTPRWAQRLAVGAAAAALLAAGFVIPAISTPHASVHPQVAQTVSPVAMQVAVASPVAAMPQPVVRVKPVSQLAKDNTAISRDNQMLQAIDVALSTPAESRASLGLETVSSEQSAPQHAPALLQD